MKSQLLKQCFSIIAMFVFTLIIGCSGDDSPSGPGNPIDPGDTTSTVIDIDGNVYRTVKIGNQVWMAENLKVTHYRNGESILHISDNTWDNQSIGAYCNYNNDANNGTLFGRLYNSYAITDTRKIAPMGWHIPTNDDWQILTSYLGGEHVAGGKMKEAGVSNWKEPNTGATNESKYSALPSGGRFSSQDFMHIGSHAFFWSSTVADNSGQQVIFNYLLFYDSKIIRQLDNLGLQRGASVRCVKN